MRAPIKRMEEREKRKKKNSSILREDRLCPTRKIRSRVSTKVCQEFQGPPPCISVVHVAGDGRRKNFSSPLSNQVFDAWHVSSV